MTASEVRATRKSWLELFERKVQIPRRSGLTLRLPSGDPSLSKQRIVPSFIADRHLPAGFPGALDKMAGHDRVLYPGVIGLYIGPPFKGSVGSEIPIGPPLAGGPIEDLTPTEPLNGGPM